jgi:hypothetical protein
MGRGPVPSDTTTCPGSAVGRFRLGASSQLNDVLMQVEFQWSGRCQDPDDFTLE